MKSINHLKKKILQKSRPGSASLFASLLLLALGSSNAYSASFVSFNTSFDFGTLDAADQATFQSTIDTALSFYTSTLETPTPLTVNLKFASDDSVGLGQSSTFVGNISYTDFRAGLVANADSAADASALAALPTGPTPPVGSSTDLSVSLVLLRALGYTALGDNGGGLDSTISFKTSIINLDRSGPQDPDKYDLEQVAFHEINEVLGFTSGIGSPAGDPIGAADLFRFNGAGSRSFTTDPNENSYFSVDDGVTSLANFN